jgi:hypothetical protein
MQVACRLSNSGITPNTLYNAARATWRSYAYVYVAYSMPYVPVPNVTNASLILQTRYLSPAMRPAYRYYRTRTDRKPKPETGPRNSYRIIIIMYLVTLLACDARCDANTDVYIGYI